MIRHQLAEWRTQRVFSRSRARCDEAIVIRTIQRRIQVERIVALLKGTPGVAHDPGIGAGFQPTQQFADILGMGQILIVQPAKRAHRRQPGQHDSGPLVVHLAAKQRLDIGHFETRSPERQERTRVTGLAGESAPGSHPVFA